MYLRTIGRHNKDGSVVRYLQLAHTQWDPVARQAKAQVIHSFGREDQLDRSCPLLPSDRPRRRRL